MGMVGQFDFSTVANHVWDRMARRKGSDMMIKDRYVHGLILGLVSGIGLGFLFAMWIEGPRGNYLIYCLGFVVLCGILLPFIAVNLQSTRKNSEQQPSN